MDRNIEPSFYYWKTIFQLSNYEKQQLETLHIKNLYIKFFDVAWNANLHKALPIAQVNLKDKVFLNASTLQIIPTIFITNESLLKTDSTQTKYLPEKILNITKDIIVNNALKNIREIQIDCDWTASTKDKYFAMLKQLQLLDTSIIFSITIRLHQIKFENKTGIPPVKKGMLMCYNMGNLTNPNATNSILDNAELLKYISHLQNYPIPLDVALPLFDWKVHFRNNVFKGLIQDVPTKELSPKIFKKNGNRYIALADTILNGYPFLKNDMVRDEQSNYDDIITTEKNITLKINNQHLRVALYHLDTLTLSKFTKYEMENIFDRMH